MSLSKKYYQAIASAIKASVNQDGNISKNELIRNLSVLFKADNYNFQEPLFRKEC